MSETETLATSASSEADRLNRTCYCLSLDREALCQALERESDDPEFCTTFVRPRTHLFSNVPVFMPATALASMQRMVTAIEAAALLPSYQSTAMTYAPAIAQADRGPLGAFMGYDFHLDDDGPRLIEINTNAGGAVLNSLLARAQRACCADMERGLATALADDFDGAVVRMFREEWRLQRGAEPLSGIIAIVDDKPGEQYLYPEFVLARKLLQKAGIETVIADASELRYEQGQLLAAGRPIGLVYNRLVDFALERPEHSALRSAYENGAVVLTPNPHNHALFADKRNLTLLSDRATLAAWGLSPALCAELAGVPRTVVVTPGNAEALWLSRKQLFFKPAGGHGGKAVYRGDKVTRGVWQEIIKGGYVAQEFAAPGERMIRLDGTTQARKVDVRLYTYAGHVLITAARLYQGQTTNFRTPGGGFAPVFAV